MEILKMQIIFNIANMREVISGQKMDLDNLQNYDVSSMSIEELRELQSNLIPYYNEAVKQR